MQTDWEPLAWGVYGRGQMKNALPNHGYMSAQEDG